MRDGRASAFIRANFDWLAIAIVAVIYMATITPGHPIDLDDFAGYVMHAEHLAEGQPYALKFIESPHAVAITPAYPPVFPLMLAPVYKVFGLNLVAMKVVVALSFLVFLILFLRLVGLPPYARLALVFIVSFNPLFWNYRNYVLSEIPYLMFSVAALLTVERVYRNLTANEWHWREAALTAFLICCAYGTRTMGIVLIPALILVDLMKFKRPSRFLLLVLVSTALFAAAQTLLVSPKTYARMTDYAPASVWKMTVFYGKTLSYVWANGVSKKFQIAFALLFTGFSAAGLVRSLRKPTIVEFYMLGYVAVLVTFTSEDGLRYLLPILPFYFYYAAKEFTGMGRRWRPAVGSLVIAAIALTYAGNFRAEAKQPDVRDAAFQQMCEFIRDHTGAEDMVVFIKPRTVTLYTGRPSTRLTDDYSESAEFLKTVNAKIIVEASWGTPIWRDFIARNGSEKLFENSEYKVFRLNPT